MAQASLSSIARPLSANLERLRRLSDTERDLVNLVDRKPAKIYHPNASVASEELEVRAPLVVMSGWACRAHILADGRRQILGILIPGDLIGFHSLPCQFETSRVVSLTRVRTVEAPELVSAWRAHDTHPALSEAISTALAEEQYFMACHVTRLGRQLALERMAHLLLELDFRLSSRGMSSNEVMALPLTQDIIGDVLGLSVVHVNRTLQTMRRQNMIELERGRLTIKDREALRSLAEFKPPKLSTNVQPRIREMQVAL